jgi:hypothetical protein
MALVSVTTTGVVPLVIELTVPPIVIHDATLAEAFLASA